MMQKQKIQRNEVCQMCKQEYPEEFGGTCCPRCDDLLREAQEMQQEMREMQEWDI